MQVVYTGEEMPDTVSKSIFLAGPSLRPGQEKEQESWRKDALQILEDKGFDGVVFVPEHKGFKFPDDKEFNYDDQIEWEHKYLNIADCIVFWVPRDLEVDKEGNIKLPAFTTNIEFGFWSDTGKIVFGYPEGAEKVDYLELCAEKYNVPIGNTLTETLDNALKMLDKGSERVDGERYVPLFIWNTDSFQSWYSAQKEAGNVLKEAEVLFSFRPRYKSFVFLWVLKVNIYITEEKRNKTNEFVLSRPDISSVCLWYDAGGESIFDKEIVLVKEFRSPAATQDGFIRELPSGSSHKNDANPNETASEELLEETGFHIKPDRLKSGGARQLAGTLSAHKSYLFYAEIDEEEIKWFKSQKDIKHGKAEDTEITYIEVFSVKDLLESENTDWTTLGQILSIVCKV